MTEEINKDIKEEVIKKIENGEIKMKSKSYFVFKLLCLAILVFMVFVVSIFFLSYILFSLSSGGHFFLLQFGLEGIYNFFITLPWIFLAINIFLLILLDKLLRSFEFGYKSPFLYLFIGTFIFVTIVSTLINLTSFHPKLMSNFGNKKIPLTDSFYKESVRPNHFPGSFRGVVLSVYMNTFDMTYGSTSIRVIALPDQELENYLKEGDLVFVAGEIIDKEIKAYGIKKLSN